MCDCCFAHVSFSLPAAVIACWQSYCGLRVARKSPQIHLDERKVMERTPKKINTGGERDGSERVGKEVSLLCVGKKEGVKKARKREGCTSC